MKRTWKPIVAGTIMIATSIPYWVASTRWFVTREVFPEELGGGPIGSWLGIIVLLPFAFPLVAGAICAMLRRAWGLAFLGAVAPLAFTLLLAPFGWVRLGPEYIVRSLSVFVRYSFDAMVYLLMVAAAVMIYLSRNEFKGRRSAAEHLFSPPRRPVDSENGDHFVNVRGDTKRIDR
jgi:hypothetical protein